jgi:aminoglycoside phosphotransferase (APT) family kinase protein
VSANAARSRTTLAEGLTRWFEAQHPQWTDISVTVDRPQPGLSSDTLMLAVSTASSTEHFVARLPPVGATVFPDYDLARQARVQNEVGARGIAAAPALAHETDESWIGTAFLLMPRVAGHTLTTNPAYVKEGWLADQSAEAQLHVITSFVELMASIHRLPVDALELGMLTGGGPSLTGMLDYWEQFLDWATPDHESTDVYRSALRWCRDRMPADPPPSSLLWGDPQLTNLVLSDDGGIAAALDFEMAGYGPAEVDLAWFLSLHEHGAATAGAELAGYPGRDAIIECYRAALGRPVDDLEWYEVLANIRSGAIVVRIGELMQRGGHSASWTALVPQHRFLAELIGA